VNTTSIGTATNGGRIQRDIGMNMIAIVIGIMIEGMIGTTDIELGANPVEFPEPTGSPWVFCARRLVACAGMEDLNWEIGRLQAFQPC
jgi:hypothetical protein